MANLPHICLNVQGPRYVVPNGTEEITQLHVCRIASRYEVKNSFPEIEPLPVVFFLTLQEAEISAAGNTHMFHKNSFVDLPGKLLHTLYNSLFVNT